MIKYFLFSLIIFLPLTFTECKADNRPDKDPGLSANASSEVSALTDDTFRKLIFNYDENKEWKYEGTRPAIIDFYADWCPPCRVLSPLVEEIAREYEGKIDVFKVDTDQEKLLAQKLGIRNLPTLLFIPVKGEPQAVMGALPKESLVKAINEVLLIN
jgi:thioredoxin